MSQMLYNTFQAVNPEVVAVETFMEHCDLTDVDNTNDDADVFQCGKCKEQFSSLGSFIEHKRNHQLGNVSAVPEAFNDTLVCNTSNEPDLTQLQPILFRESDIMSFSIGQAGVDLATADQPEQYGGCVTTHCVQELSGFEGNEMLHLHQSQDCELEDKHTPAFHLHPGQIILTTQITSEEPIERLMLTQDVPDSGLQYTLGEPINYLAPDPLIITTNTVDEEEENQIDVLEEENPIDVLEEENQIDVLEEENQIDVLEEENQIDVLEEENQIDILEEENQIDVLEEENQIDVLEEKNQIDVLEEENQIDILEEENKSDVLEDNDKRNLTTKKKLKCPYCVKEFTKKFDLQQHLRSHTGERPFQCVVCGRSFTQKSNVKKHMATHKVWPEKIRTFPENLIQKAPTSLDGETILIIDDLFGCQYCPATFNTFAQLKAHRKTHIDNKIFKCVQKNCEGVFETLDLFLEHTAAHQSECDAQYTCCFCRRQFTSLDDLGHHQGLHTCAPRQKRPSTMVCKVCKRKFTTLGALEKHQASDPHAYTCPECNKVYVCERRLRNHVLLHSSVAAHVCGDCGKKFKTAQNLSAHSLVHSSEKPFVCKLCPAAFARRDRLNRHTFIHDLSHRYKCPFNKHLGCTKEFYRKDKLKLHLLTHAVSKSLKCKRCSRVFKRSLQLRQHETVCLSEDKPCKDCGHVTSSLDNYKNTGKTREETGSHVNRRKHRLLEGVQQVDDGVPTLQVVVVPISAAYPQS